MNNIEARSELVVKSNDLIRNTRYELNEVEQKFIVYLISRIKKEDKELTEVNINLRDYCKTAGIKPTGGVITHMKDTIRNISNKSWWLATGKNEETLFRWVDTATIKGETAKVKLSQSLIPFLLELKKDFTKYELMYVLCLRGKYAVRLYEILKSYLFQGEWLIELSQLKQIIRCEGYDAYKEFNRNVLKTSIQEINDYTDLAVSYETIKEGRSVKYINFKISDMKTTDDYIESYQKRKKRMK